MRNSFLFASITLSGDHIVSLVCMKLHLATEDSTKHSLYKQYHFYIEQILSWKLTNAVERNTCIFPHVNQSVRVINVNSIYNKQTTVSEKNNFVSHIHVRPYWIGMLCRPAVQNRSGKWPSWREPDWIVWSISNNEISVYINSLHVTTHVEETETATLATEQVSRILYIHYTPRIMQVRALIYIVVVWYSI